MRCLGGRRADVKVEVVHPVLRVAPLAERLEAGDCAAPKLGNEIDVGGADQYLAGLGEAHDAEGSGDAVAKQARATTGVRLHTHGSEVDADVQAKSPLARRSAEKAGGAQRILGVADVTDGAALAGVGGEAALRRHAGNGLTDQRCQELATLLVRRLGRSIGRRRRGDHVAEKDRADEAAAFAE
ncbi:MAG: hypothetical protein AW07_00764 [Candidatus Accumulibacter sp. SK-11]|nr:MAG: hypothetical protein AW07_00764 [Candidatus Accumulibacter sp. SK-11]